MSRSWRGKVKLSGSPPKKAICLLGGEDEPHVGVLLVPVEVVLAALVERHHVAAQAGRRVALVLDRRDRRLAGLAAPPCRTSPASPRRSTRAVTSSIAGEDVDLVAGAGRPPRRASARRSRSSRSPCSALETFWMQPRPTWWLVIMRPSGETKEPEPPSMKRTEARRSWSSHSVVGSKPYFSLSGLRGRVVERPHALVGEGRAAAGGGENRGSAAREQRDRHVGLSLRAVFRPRSPAGRSSYAPATARPW